MTVNFSCLPQHLREMLIKELDQLGFDTFPACIDAILTHSDFLERWDFSDIADRYKYELRQWKRRLQTIYNIRQVDLPEVPDTEKYLTIKAKDSWAYLRNVNHSWDSYTGETYGYPFYPNKQWHITADNWLRIDAILCHHWGYQLLTLHGNLCPPTKINFPIYATENNDPIPAFNRMEAYINQYYISKPGLPAYSNSHD